MGATVTRLDPVRTVHVVITNDRDEPLCAGHFLDYVNEAAELVDLADTEGDCWAFASPGTTRGHGAAFVALVPESKIPDLRTGLATLRQQYEQVQSIRLAIVENMELL